MTFVYSVFVTKRNNMHTLKLIPLVLFGLLVLLTIGWIFIGWSFVTLLPWFIILSVMLLTNLSDIRSTWELLSQTGLIGIQLYLYQLARSSQLIKGKLSVLIIVPFIASACSVGAANIFGTSLTIAWWSLFIALLLALLGLLFGFRKKQII